MDLTISQVSDGGSGQAARERLVSEKLLSFKNDCYASAFQRTVKISFIDLIERVRAALRPLRTEVRAYEPTNAVFLIPGDATFFVLYGGDRYRSHDPWEVTSRSIILEGFGDKDLLKRVRDTMDKLVPDVKYASLTWEFTTQLGSESRELSIDSVRPGNDAFYPFLSGGVRHYQERYLKSDSSVLILLGPPGTGKTSFIRDMIHTHGLKTTFTYDEQLLDSDNLFVNFISGGKDLLVVEDADVFLADRERGGNQKMARFLNVSDGLAAPVHPKKIIFTANISNRNQIDQALLRPGRCFDCQTFRKLTFEEAIAAADAAGLPWRSTEERSYTLAEIFALGRGETFVTEPIKLGVGR